MAQLLSTNVSGTLAVTQNTTVSGNLIVSGYNVLNEIFQADNLARVSANSGSTQSAVALNFVNTATVQVSVTSGGAGIANIGFTSTVTANAGSGINNFPVSVNTGSTITSNGLNFINSSTVTVTVSQGINGNANISFTSLSGGGSVQSVATGIGLTGGTITSTGTISANIANTTVQGVTKLIDSVTTNDAANAATGAAVKTAYDQATSAYGQANAAFTTANNAANTVRVTANSGSIQSAVSLNFINTASVQVSVGAGTSGNANIAFNATNIADNVRILSGATRASNVQILSNGRLTEWSHLRDGNFYPILNETTSSGVFAGNNGNSIYVTGSAQDNVTQYNLTTAWNVASASFAANAYISADESVPADLFFRNDGSRMYVLGDTGNDITYYTLGTPWSLSGTITLGGAYSISAQTTTPRGMHISDDGTKMWVVGGNGASTVTNTVFQYTVASPWDLTTASYDNKFVSTIQDNNWQAISLNPSGTIMLLLGSVSKYIYEYYLSTANDVTTATYTGRRKDVQRRTIGSTTESVPIGFHVSYQNNRMYLVGTASDSIIEYKTDGGLTIDADSLSVEGFGLFQDSLFVGEDLRVADSVIIDNALDVAGAITTTGSLSVSGTTLTLGTATSNTTHTLGSGATAASRIKAVDIGTGGVAGSITNITVGPTGVAANVNINANTVTISNTVNIGNQLVVSGLNILNEIGLADNLTRVAANSGSVISNIALNFVNTSSVTVSVTPGEPGYANIAFTSTATSSGGGINTFPVSANTGSTVSANGINFSNSSTIRVNVGAGITGNANISFDYIGSVTGGSGINTFPVSANSGSTVTANGINFVNSTSVNVSVTSGTTGNANVSFTNTGVFGNVQLQFNSTTSSLDIVFLG